MSWTSVERMANTWKKYLLNKWPYLLYRKAAKRDFSGGPVVKNLPASAEDPGSIPGLRKPECHGATNPGHHKYWACTPKAGGLQQEKPPHQEAHVPQLEKARATKKTQRSHKKIVFSKAANNPNLGHLSWHENCPSVQI